VIAVRRIFLWIHFVFAAIIVASVFLQAYLIASYAMGAGEDALDAHGFVGGVVIHGSELIVFLTAFGAWPRMWGWIAVNFGLFVLGTVQIFLVPPDEDPASPWVHGLHGLFALFVLVLAAWIAWRDARALVLKPAPAAIEPDVGTPAPPPA
jgi:hypothetical protein